MDINRINHKRKKYNTFITMIKKQNLSGVFRNMNAGDSQLLEGYNQNTVKNYCSNCKVLGEKYFTYAFNDDGSVLVECHADKPLRFLTDEIRAISEGNSVLFDKSKRSQIHATVSQMHDGDQFEVKTVVEVRRVKGGGNG